MKPTFFHLTPVRHSSEPHYPKRIQLMMHLAAVSATGLTVSACTVSFQENQNVCTPGEAMCQDSDTLVMCDDNHVRHVIDCNTYCVANYGENYVSDGCNASNKENPCACNYNQIEGFIAQCQPNEIYCVDGEHIHYCDMSLGMENWGTPAETTCTEYCKAVYGPHSKSVGGCTEEDPENPCNCYDLLDGDVAQCQPSEILCIDEGQVAICNDLMTYDYFQCDEKCVADFGEGAISQGCDVSRVDNPCQCVIPE